MAMRAHKGENHLFLKAISVFVLITFLTTSVSFAEPSLSLEPKALSREAIINTLVSRINIPAEMGSIKEVYQPGSQSSSDSSLRSQGSGLVVHIEEPHGQPEAQKNIERILARLQSEYGLKTIYLEGAWDKLDPENLHFFKDPKLQETMMEELTKVGLAGGVERFLSARNAQRATAESKKNSLSVARSPLREPKAYGVEDVELYKKNLEEFRAVYARKTESDAFLQKLRSRIADEAGRTLNSELKTFFKEWAFRAEIAGDPFEGLGDLARQADRHLGLDLTDAREQYDWPALVRFFKLKKIEQEAYSVQRTADSEREKLLNWMDQKGLAGQKKILGFLNAERYTLNAERSGDIRSSMERFFESASPKGFRFKDYPHLTKRIGIAILSSELQAEDLFKETGKLRGKILEKLAAKPEEKAIIERYQEYLLLRKLFSLELTRDEYQRLVAQRATLNAQREKLTSPALNVARSALRFYKTAQQRDRVMFDKMLAQMKALQEPNAILVTGGYHSEGLSEFFKKSGISFVRIAPRVTKLESQDAYIQLMTLGTGSSRNAQRTTSKLQADSLRAARSALRDEGSNLRFLSIGMNGSSIEQIGPAAANSIRGEIRTCLDKVTGPEGSPFRGELRSLLTPQALQALSLTGTGDSYFLGDAYRSEVRGDEVPVILGDEEKVGDVSGLNPEWQVFLRQVEPALPGTMRHNDLGLYPRGTHGLIYGDPRMIRAVIAGPFLVLMLDRLYGALYGILVDAYKRHFMDTGVATGKEGFTRFFIHEKQKAEAHPEVLKNILGALEWQLGRFIRKGILPDLRKKILFASTSLFWWDTLENLEEVFGGIFPVSSGTRLGLHFSTVTTLQEMGKNAELFKDARVWVIGSGDGVLARAAASLGAKGSLLFEMNPASLGSTDLLMPSHGMNEVSLARLGSKVPPKGAWHLVRGNYRNALLDWYIKVFPPDVIILNWGPEMAGPDPELSDKTILRDLMVRSRDRYPEHQVRLIINSGYAREEPGITPKTFSANKFFNGMPEVLRQLGFENVEPLIFGTQGPEFFAMHGTVVARSDPPAQQDGSVPGEARAEMRAGHVTKARGEAEESAYVYGDLHGAKTSSDTFFIPGALLEQGRTDVVLKGKDAREYLERRLVGEDPSGFGMQGRYFDGERTYGAGIRLVAGKIFFSFSPKVHYIFQPGDGLLIDHLGRPTLYRSRHLHHAKSYPVVTSREMPASISKKALSPITESIQKRLVPESVSPAGAAGQGTAAERWGDPVHLTQAQIENYIRELVKKASKKIPVFDARHGGVTQRLSVDVFRALARAQLGIVARQNPAGDLRWFDESHPLMPLLGEKALASMARAEMREQDSAMRPEALDVSKKPLLKTQSSRLSSSAAKTQRIIWEDSRQPRRGKHDSLIKVRIGIGEDAKEGDMPAVVQVQGKRIYQEDHYVNLPIDVGSSIPHGKGWMLGVMDGHGGDEAADYIEKNLPVFFKEALAETRGDVHAAMEICFQKLHKATQDMESGSTLSFVYLPEDEASAYVFTVGDSPVIVRSGEEYFVTEEHTVSHRNEREALIEWNKKYGRKLDKDYFFKSHLGQLRLALPVMEKGKIVHFQGLELTRSFGDKGYRKFLVPSPEILRVDLEGTLEDLDIVVATDGLWGGIGGAQRKVKWPAILQILGAHGPRKLSPLEALIHSAGGIHAPDNTTAIHLRLSARSESRTEPPVEGKGMEEDFHVLVRDMIRLMMRKDPDTFRHSGFVKMLAILTADEMHFATDPIERDIFTAAAVLHDLGKLSTPDEILLKPGKHTPDETEVMHGHAELGPYILAQIQSRFPEEFKKISWIIIAHHERYDGKGYPAGLKGAEIPLGARILAVADSFDAMTAQRVYNKPLSHDEALKELRDKAGTQFDPQVVEAFIRAYGKYDRMKKAAFFRSQALKCVFQAAKDLPEAVSEVQLLQDLIRSREDKRVLEILRRLEKHIPRDASKLLKPIRKFLSQAHEIERMDPIGTSQGGTLRSEIRQQKGLETRDLRPGTIDLSLKSQVSSPKSLYLDRPGMLSDAEAHALFAQVQEKLFGKGELTEPKIYSDLGLDVTYEAEKVTETNHYAGVVRFGPLVFVIIPTDSLFGIPAKVWEFRRKLGPLYDQYRDNILFTFPSVYRMQDGMDTQDPINLQALRAIHGMLAHREKIRGATVHVAGGAGGILAGVALKLGAKRAISSEKEFWWTLIGRWLAFLQGWHRYDPEKGKGQIAFLNKDITSAAFEKEARRFRMDETVDVAIANLGYWAMYGNANDKAAEFAAKWKNVKLFINSGFYSNTLASGISESNQRPLVESLRERFQQSGFHATVFGNEPVFAGTLGDRLHEIRVPALVALRSELRAEDSGQGSASSVQEKQNLNAERSPLYAKRGRSESRAFSPRQDPVLNLAPPISKTGSLKGSRSEMRAEPIIEALGGIEKASQILDGLNSASVQGSLLPAGVSEIPKAPDIINRIERLLGQAEIPVTSGSMALILSLLDVSTGEDGEASSSDEEVRFWSVGWAHTAKILPDNSWKKAAELMIQNAREMGHDTINGRPLLVSGKRGVDSLIAEDILQIRPGEPVTAEQIENVRAYLDLIEIDSQQFGRNKVVLSALGREIEERVEVWGRGITDEYRALLRSRGPGRAIDELLKLAEDGKMSAYRRRVNMSDAPMGGKVAEGRRVGEDMMSRSIVTGLALRFNGHLFPVGVERIKVFIGEALNDRIYEPLVHEIAESMIVAPWLFAANKTANRYSALTLQRLAELEFSDLLTNLFLLKNARDYHLSAEEILRAAMWALPRLFFFAAEMEFKNTPEPRLPQVRRHLGKGTPAENEFMEYLKTFFTVMQSGIYYPHLRQTVPVFHLLQKLFGMDRKEIKDGYAMTAIAIVNMFFEAMALNPNLGVNALLYSFDRGNTVPNSFGAGTIFRSEIREAPEALGTRTSHLAPRGDQNQIESRVPSPKSLSKVVRSEMRAGAEEIFGSGIAAWLEINRATQWADWARLAAVEAQAKREGFQKMLRENDRVEAYEILRMMVEMKSSDGRIGVQPGTTSLHMFLRDLRQYLDKFLPGAASKKIPLVSLSLSDYVMLITALKSEEVWGFLTSQRFKALPPSSKLREIIREMEQSGVVLQSRHLTSIYSALPEQLAPGVTRKEIGAVDVSIEVYDQIEAALADERVVAFIRGELIDGWAKEDRLAALYKYIVETAKLPLDTGDLSQLYSVLPDELPGRLIKKDTIGYVNLSYTAYRQLRDALNDPRLADYLASPEFLGKQVRPRAKELIAKIVTLGIPLSSRDPVGVSTGLPAELRVLIDAAGYPRSSGFRGANARAETRTGLNPGQDPVLNLATPIAKTGSLRGVREEFAHAGPYEEILEALSKFTDLQKSKGIEVPGQTANGISFSTLPEMMPELVEAFEEYAALSGKSLKDVRLLDVGTDRGAVAAGFASLTGAEVTSIEIEPLRYEFATSFMDYLILEKGFQFRRPKLEKRDFLKRSVRDQDLIYFFFSTGEGKEDEFAEAILEKLEREMKEGALFVSPLLGRTGVAGQTALRKFFSKPRSIQFRPVWVGGIPGIIVGKNVDLERFFTRSEMRQSSQPRGLKSRTKFSDTEQRIAMDAAEHIFRAEKVALFGKSELRNLLTKLVPSAYSQEQENPGLKSLVSSLLSKTENAPFQISITLTGKPFLGDPVMQLLTQVLVQKPLMRVQIVIPGISQTDISSFQQELMKKVLAGRRGQKGIAKGVNLVMASDTKEIPGFLKPNQERALVYDMRQNGRAALEGLVSSVDKAQTLLVFDDAALSQKAFALLAALDRLFDKKALPEGVQSASGMLAQYIQIASEAAKAILRAA